MKPEQQLWAAVPLVAMAGCVDAIGWLRLDEMFIGIITGNSTLLGVAMAGGEWHRAGALAGLVGLFALGAMLGAFIGLKAKRWRIPAVLATVGTLFAVSAFLPFEGLVPPALFALVPAMGMVNTALPAAGGITFLTGTLVRSMQFLVGGLAGDLPPGTWLPHFCAWVGVVLGATLGAAVEMVAGAQAVLVPAFGLYLGAALVARNIQRAG